MFVTSSIPKDEPKAPSNSIPTSIYQCPRDETLPEPAFSSSSSPDTDPTRVFCLPKLINNIISIAEIVYIPFFHSRSLKFIVYFKFIAHLNLE